MAKKTPDRPAQPVPKVAVAPASPDGPNRKVRKEEARRQREALQRKIARRRTLRWGIAAAVVLVAIGVGTAIALSGGSSKKTPTGPSASPTLVGMQTGLAPWNAGHDGLKERLQAMGFPVLSAEALAFHHHNLIQIFIDGKPVTVPAYIGINNTGPPSQEFITVLHTHDASGIVHIESPVAKTFTLGDFFNVWGVSFSSSNIGGYQNAGNKQVRVFLDGKPYAGDPRNLALTQHEDVVITYGTKAQLPKPIPITYSSTLSPSCAGSC